MNNQVIAETNRYVFSNIHLQYDDPFAWVESKGLTTIFIHSGQLAFTVKTGNIEKNFDLVKGQGCIICPGTVYSVATPVRAHIFQAYSEVRAADQPIVEIVDTGTDCREVEIKQFKIIDGPKRISKPWGFEVWVVWFRDFHVLKQIGMVQGKRTSLQYHREKLETSFVVTGACDLIEGYEVKLGSPNEESVAGIDFEKYATSKKAQEHWTIYPGTVHRVTSQSNDFMIYEVSTPELDDVIRLQDDEGRASGRIVEEHLSRETKIST